MSDILKPTPEFVEKLREPILVLTRDEILHLQELLGMELVYGVRKEHPGKYCISRLAFATALFNDAELGKRLAVLSNDDGDYTGFGLIDMKNQYIEIELEETKQVRTGKPLELLGKLARDELFVEKMRTREEALRKNLP